MSDTSYNNEDEIMRRRQEQRRRKKQEERIKKQKRNRIIILAVGIAVLVFIVFGISSCVSSCSSKNKKNNENEATAVAVEQQTNSGEQTVATQEQPTQAATLMEAGADVPDNGQDGYTTDSGVYIWNGQGFELFYGDSDLAKTYAATVSNCRQKIDSSINVYNIVVPIHIAFGLPERLEKTVDSLSQSDYLNNVYSNYTAEGIKAVNIFNSLKQHRAEYTFFNTDHHWTSLGSCYAYQEFCNAAGETPVDINTLHSKEIEGFVGSLYNATEVEELKNHADTVKYYEMPVTYTMDVMMEDSTEFSRLDSMYYEDAGSGGNSYGVFIWGDNPVTKIVNEQPKNGRKILVIKESYGNAFVPWLANNYDEVHAIDFRHYEGNVPSYCSENGITDIIFINGVMSSASAFQLESMESLF